MTTTPMMGSPMISQPSYIQPQQPSFAQQQPRHDPNQIQHDSYGNRFEYNTAPSPGSLRKKKFLSLESLAVELGINQLMGAGDINEVLSSDFKTLHDKYGVTGNQYARLKEYKESL